MATISTSQNINAVTYASAEDLTINSGAVLTIDAQVPADVTKLSTFMGSMICTTSGTLYVLNNSTTTPLVITVSGNTKDLRFEKNGAIIMRGAPIEIGTTTGGASETFSLNSPPLDTIPYPGHIQVETSAGSGIYKNYIVAHIAGYTQNWATTEFSAGGYPAGQVLFWDASTRQIIAGDGTNGNLLPGGCKVRIPNIYIHSNSTNATPANRSIIDITPSGTLDCEWTCFSHRWHFANTTFNKLRMINCGFGGHFSATSSNGSVELEYFTVAPDTEQTTIATNFDINLILGYTKISNVVTCRGGLVTGSSRNRLGQLFALDPLVDNCIFARRNGITTGNDESLAIINVPAGTVFNNVHGIGGRIELSNLANVQFLQCGQARSLGTAQLTTGATNSWVSTNCAGLQWIGGGNAGVSASRNQWLSVDSQSSNLQVFNLVYEGGDNSGGAVTSAGADVYFTNCFFPNVRSNVFVDSPTTFLSSFTHMRNVRGSGASTILNDATQGAIYDVCVGTPNDFSTVFSGATSFAFANLVDKGLTASTGNVVLGPFGNYDQMTFGGQAQLDQAGSVEMTKRIL